jgi:hypothetical protein
MGNRSNPAGIQLETLRCKTGGHDWQRPMKRGRTPANCPDHKPKPKRNPAGYYREWKPSQKSKILLGQVTNILDEYADYLPLTVRQVYYRMIAAFKHEKGDTFKNALYDLLVNARRATDIPFWKIRDDGIMGGGAWYRLEDHLEGCDRALNDHHTDQQFYQDVRMEAWTESAGMLPQVARVCDQYAIPAYSCGGFNSLTSIRQVVDTVIEEERWRVEAGFSPRKTVLLHLGDWDPSGVSMLERIDEDVKAFLAEDSPKSEFVVVQVALTEEQIAKLPAEPLTTKDQRSLAWTWMQEGRKVKWELEALPPNLIASLLTEQIEANLGKDGLTTREVVLDRERLERAALKSLPGRIALLPALQEQIEERPLELLYPSPATSGILAR